MFKQHVNLLILTWIFVHLTMGVNSYTNRHLCKNIRSMGRGGKGANTARLYVFVECALCLQSLFQQNKNERLFYGNSPPYR